jgi:phenylalanyl-tRNA synthetase beta chain
MLFEAPSHRGDIEREIDLIEEIVRVNSYDKIAYTLPLMEITPNHEDTYVEFIDTVKGFLAGNGFNETISFPFIGSEDLSALNLPEDHPYRSLVYLQNPLVEQQNAMTPTSLIALIRAVAGNRRRGDKGSRLFEVCRGFYELQGAKLAAAYSNLSHLTTNGRHISPRAQKDVRPIERYLVGGIMDQPFAEKGWDTPLTAGTFYHGKAAIQSLLHGLGVSNIQLMPIVPSEMPWLNPSCSALITHNKKFMGYVGELHPKTTAFYEIPSQNCPIVFEFDMELLFEKAGMARTYSSVINRFPPITWDLAFVVDKTVTYEQFVASLNKYKKAKHLSKIELFDVYEGSNLPQGKKSMAFTLQFVSPERTLVDKEVEAEVQGLIGHVGEELGAVLR